MYQLALGTQEAVGCPAGRSCVLLGEGAVLDMFVQLLSNFKIVESSRLAKKTLLCGYEAKYGSMVASRKSNGHHARVDDVHQRCGLNTRERHEL